MYIYSLVLPADIYIISVNETFYHRMLCCKIYPCLLTLFCSVVEQWKFGSDSEWCWTMGYRPALTFFSFQPALMGHRKLSLLMEQQVVFKKTASCWNVGWFNVFINGLLQHLIFPGGTSILCRIIFILFFINVQSPFKKNLFNIIIDYAVISSGAVSVAAVWLCLGFELAGWLVGFLAATICLVP